MKKKLLILTNEISFYKNKNINYNIYDIHNVNLLNNGKYDYLIIKGKFNLDNETINNIYENFISSNSKLLSPVVIFNNKLEYFGGIINNGEILYFNEEHIELNKFKNNKNYVCKTMLPYDNFFLINGKYLNKTNDIVDFALILKSCSVDQINYVELLENQEYKNKVYDNKYFNFEKECIREILNLNQNECFVSLKFCKYKTFSINNNKNILIIEQELIKPDKDCGAKFTFNFIKTLVNLQYNIYLLHTNLEYIEKYATPLQKMGVYVFFGFEYKIENLIKNNCNLFDYVIINRLQGMNDTFNFVKKYCQNAKIIYNTHDIHFLREERENLITNKITNGTVKQKELTYMENSDICNIVSLYENNYFDLNYPIIKKQYFPICYPVSKIQRDFKNTKDIYFIGSRHTPNVECINFFISNVWDKIIILDNNIKLYIIGSCCDYIDDKNKNKNNICYLGFVEDDYLENVFFNTIRLCIAPLRYGAGVKGKILQSSQFKIPCITTNIGYEGTDFVNNESILVFNELNLDNSHLFAEFIVKSYNDISLLEKIGNNSYGVMEKFYSLENCRKNCISLFNKLKLNSQKQCKKNICVILNCYKNHSIIKYIKQTLDIMFNDIYFDYYMVNNNIQNHKIINNNYSNICNVILGDNTEYEFSGIQKCINILIDNNKIKHFDSFLFLTDALLNYPINHLLLLNQEHFYKSFELNKVIGHIDSWGKIYVLDDFTFDSWMRSNFILMNSNALKNINYGFLSYKFDDIKKLNTDSELKTNLSNWLSQNRYNSAILEKKLCCIYNEYKLTHKLKKMCFMNDMNNLDIIDYYNKTSNINRDYFRIYGYTHYFYEHYEDFGKYYNLYKYSENCNDLLYLGLNSQEDLNFILNYNGNLGLILFEDNIAYLETFDNSDVVKNKVKHIFTESYEIIQFFNYAIYMTNLFDYKIKQKNIITILTTKYFVSITNVLKDFFITKNFIVNIFDINTEKELLHNNLQNNNNNNHYLLLYQPFMFEYDSWKIKFKYIIYNFEQYLNNYINLLYSRYISSGNFDELYRNSYLFLDYTEYNVKYIQNKFGYNSLCLPPPINKNIFDCGDILNKTYDVIFIGNISERRKYMIKKIGEKYNVYCIEKIFGNEIFDIMRKSKILINIHCYENALLERIRLNEALLCGMRIISEKPIIQDIEICNIYDKVVNFVDVGDINNIIYNIKQILDNYYDTYDSYIDNVKNKLTELDRDFNKNINQIYNQFIG